MAHTFVARLLHHVRQHNALSRIDDMTLSQLLTRSRAIMSDEKELVTAAAQPVKGNTSHTYTDKSASQGVVKCVTTALD